MPSLRLGTVPFLNAIPLTWGLAADRTVELRKAAPARLEAQLQAGELDVALLPAADYLRHPDWTVAGSCGISCDGPAESVRLFWRPNQPVAPSLPPAPFPCKTVRLDPASRSSNALCRLLLGKFWKTSVRFQVPVEEPQPRAPGPGGPDEARLMIGDVCLQAHATGEPGWDLGELWKLWTGLPFVFALWVAREASMAERARPLLERSRELGMRRRADIAREEALRLSLPTSLCRRYLTERIRYQLGEREWKGLRRFAEELGIPPAGIEPAFSV